MTPWLLLHGFTGAPASWDAVRAQLPDVEAFTEPLVGHDPSVPDPQSFDGEVDRLAARLSRYGRPVAVAGYSLGARVALGLCVRHPALVERALLVGVNPGLDEADRPARRADDARWMDVLDQMGVDAFCAAWEAQPLFAGERVADPTRVAAAQAIRRQHSAAGLRLALLRLGLAAMPDFRQAWPTLPMPIQLMAGATDAKFVSLARALVAARPQSTVTLVPGCGHSLLVEAPHAVAQSIRRMS